MDLEKGVSQYHGFLESQYHLAEMFIMKNNNISIPVLQGNIKRPFWRKTICYLSLFMDCGWRILCMAGVLYVISACILVGFCHNEDFCYELLIIFSIIYIVEVLLFTIIALLHIHKWYIKTIVRTINCPTCGSVVNIKNRKDEDSSMDVNFSISIITFFQYYYVLLMILFRPRLYLHCPHCGVEEIVCPYCNKPISEEDKKCPHCGKRVL